MIPPRYRLAAVLIVLATLFALRAIAGALLPLSADEAYYWLWSKHLAWGYYDHPPLIALLIRAGTAIFGDTPLGLRVFPILFSVLASWAVWRAAALITRNDNAALAACLFFNLTLMVTVELTFATPDAPALMFAALFLLALAKVEIEANGYWWLAAGIAGGLGLLSKYTFMFMGVSAVAWMLADPSKRFWLRTPWPYLGGAIAFAIFAPNLLWNAAHGWETFVFQFGRVDHGRIDPRFIFEFAASQIGLASPFILVLGIAGMLTWRSPERPRSILAPMLIWPALVYFAIHALHDRVQGNWPSFLYPALAVTAATAAFPFADKQPSITPMLRIARRCVLPAAALMLLGVYLQLAFAILPLGRKDPMQLLLGFGFGQTSIRLQQQAVSFGAHEIITTNYQTAAWFRFYLPRTFDVVQVGQSFRWTEFPDAAPARTALYVSAPNKADFSKLRSVKLCGRVDRTVRGELIETYGIYCQSNGWIAENAKMLTF